MCWDLVSDQNERKWGGGRCCTLWIQQKLYIMDSDIYYNFASSQIFGAEKRAAMIYSRVLHSCFTNLLY